MNEPSVIRIWYPEAGREDYLVEHFRSGIITLPDDHPFVPKVWEDEFLGGHVTVLDTKEVSWKISQVRADRERRSVDVLCIPWVDWVRSILTTDERFVELQVMKSTWGDQWPEWVVSVGDWRLQ